MKEIIKWNRPSCRHEAQFENLNMKEDENVAAYFLRVDEVVNTIRGLGEEIQ